ESATQEGDCDLTSCVGCMNPSACNYDESATQEGDCDLTSCVGCMNPSACNYDESATQEGECDFETCAGCTDDSALNFDPAATIDDGSCEFCELPNVSFEVTGCNDGQFTVQITVDGLGTASPYTLSNDVNDLTSDVSEDGTITAGPFEVGTFVTFTLTSNEFDSCNETYETQGCPDNVNEANELTFVVYPNPTTDAIVIATNATGTAIISLFDLSGKVVLEQQVFFSGSNLTLDLSTLAAGAYQLRVINANMVSTQQVIVQK
ncbi:MAG: T9SS type A sorting domain-containing protein, partial [Cryomorphaceae bacterium]|nr:T9SS type A sorting domain-containing protein [Cryomorphaceae bacterium]